MFASLKKIAFAIAFTLCATTGMTLATSVAVPTPAEAGIVSSVKGAAKTVAGGVAKAAKVTAKRVIVPVGKDLYKIGKAVAKPFAPGVKVIASGVKKSWAPLKKVAKIAFPVLR